MFLMNTPLYVTHWRRFIQRCIYCLLQDWRYCGPQLFTVFRGWSSWFRNYLAGGMVCDARLIFPTRDYSLSILLLLKLGILWCLVPRLSLFIYVWIALEFGFGCSIPDKYCVCQIDLLLIGYKVKGGHPISAVLRTCVASILCEWSTRMHIWRAPPSLGHQCWW